MSQAAETIRTEEQLNLTGVHPNVRLSIELDFAHPRHSTKRALLALLGKQPGITTNKESICSELSQTKPHTVHQNLNDLVTLSEQFENQYGYRVVKTYTLVKTGPKTYTKLANYRLEITKEAAPQRRHGLCENLRKVPRETDITNERILEICNKHEVLLTTTPPDDIEERIRAARELLDLSLDETNILRTLIKSHGEGVSNKHLCAELDLPSEIFRRFHYLERDRIQPRLTELGLVTYSVRTGYRAAFFPKEDEDSETSELKSEAEKLLEALAALNEDYDKLYSQQFVIGRSGFNSLYRKRSELQKEVANLKKEAESLRRKIRRRTASLNELETRLGTLSEPGKLRLEIARLQRQIDRLRQESARMERTNRGLGINGLNGSSDEE